MFKMLAENINRKYFDGKLNDNTAETLAFKIDQLRRNYHTKTPSEVIKDFTAFESYLEALCDANIITWQERETLYRDVDCRL